MDALLILFREHMKNFYMLNRLALSELKTRYRDTSMGFIWHILNPLIQIGIYYLIFGIGIRGGRSVEGVPFFYWMLCGIVAWFFINPSITYGSSSVFSKLGQVSKMNFPLSILPTYTILTQFYNHLILLGIAIVILIFNQQHMDFHFFSLLYFMFSNLVFLVSLALLTSTLSTMLRDIHQLIQSLVRILFYVTPILWVPSNTLPSFFDFLIRLNPFAYIVEGYRISLLKMEPVDLTNQGLYFWCITLMILLLGAMLHVRFRKHFVDLL